MAWSARRTGWMWLLIATSCVLLTAVFAPRPVGGDITLVHLPQFAFYGQTLRQFQLPLWNDLADFGSPLLAEGQLGVLYPLHLVLYSLLPATNAYTTSLVLHLILAGWFAYLCGRGFQLSPPAAGLAAIVYAGQGFFIIRLAEPWSYTTGCWLPLAVHAAWRWLDQGSWRWLLGLVPILAIQLLAGHFQLAFYTQVVLLLLAVAAMLVEQGRRQTIVRRALFIPCVLVASVAAAAAQLLPTAEFVVWGDTRGQGIQFLSSFALHPFHLVNLLAPTLLHRLPFWEPVAWDPWRTSPNECLTYVGLIPLGLALWAVCCCRRPDQKTVRIWSLLLLLSALLSLGPNMLGFRWLVELPGFGWFGATARWSVVGGLILGLLAGHGLQQIDLADMRRWLARFALLAAVCIVLGLVAILGTASLIGQWGASSAEDQTLPIVRILQSELALPMLNILLIGLVTFYRPLFTDRRQLWFVVIVWTALDLCVYASLMRPITLEANRPLVEQSAVLRELAEQDTRRVGGSLGHLPMQVGIAALGSRPVPATNRYWHQIDREPINVHRTPYATLASLPRWGEMGTRLARPGLELNVDDLEFLRLSGIDRVIQPPGAALEEPDELLVKVAELADPWLSKNALSVSTGGKWTIWKPAATTARAWMFPITEPAAAGSDPRLARIPPPARRGLLNNAQTADLVALGPDQVQVSGRADSRCVLVVSDLIYPGWEATLHQNGQVKSVDIEPAFGDWRSVVIANPGSFQVDFRYRPSSYRRGWQISLGTCLLWLACVLITLNLPRDHIAPSDIAPSDIAPSDIAPSDVAPK